MRFKRKGDPCEVYAKSMQRIFNLLLLLKKLEFRNDFLNTDRYRDNLNI